MNNENRVITHSDIANISVEIEKKRQKFTNRFNEAMEKCHRFRDSVANAIGEISYEEAVQGIIDYFEEEIRKK